MRSIDIYRIVLDLGLTVDLVDMVPLWEIECQENYNHIPEASGIYAVYLDDWANQHINPLPIIPNHPLHLLLEEVEIQRLNGKRDRIQLQENTDILYIGKSINLRKRINEMVSFAQGLSGNPRGGRGLWYLEGIRDAYFYIWVCETPPKRDLLERFRHEHEALPFGNGNKLFPGHFAH